MEVSTEFLETLLGKFGTGPEACIPILQSIQEECRYVPLTALAYICEHSDISPTQISGVATFYTQFRLAPVGQHIIKVCHGTACHVGGATGLTEALEEHLQIKSGENTADNVFTLEKVACIGCCSLAPVIMVDDNTHGRLDRNSVVAVVQDYHAKASEHTDAVVSERTDAVISERTDAMAMAAAEK